MTDENPYEPNSTAAQVREGDVIDAEPVPYFAGDVREMAVFELFEVTSVVRETDRCVVIYTDQGGAGMPPETPIYVYRLAT